MWISLDGELVFRLQMLKNFTSSAILVSFSVCIIYLFIYRCLGFVFPGGFCLLVSRLRVCRRLMEGDFNFVNSVQRERGME